MMMSGSGASTCTAGYGRAATSRLTEVTTTAVPAGHRQPGGPGQETCRARSGGLCLAPVERRAVDPDAVKDDGDLAGNGDLRLLHTYPLRELHAPGLEGIPLLSASCVRKPDIIEAVKDAAAANDQKAWQWVEQAVIKALKSKKA